MAGELNLGFSLALQKSGATLNRSYSASVDVEGRAVASGNSQVTLAGLLVDAGQIVSIGHIAIKHMAENSTANYLYVGESGVSHPFALKPGEWIAGRWNLAQIHVIPDAGQCYVETAVVST